MAPLRLLLQCTPTNFLRFFFYSGSFILNGRRPAPPKEASFFCSGPSTVNCCKLRSVHNAKQTFWHLAVTRRRQAVQKTCFFCATRSLHTIHSRLIRLKYSMSWVSVSLLFKCIVTEWYKSECASLYLLSLWELGRGLPVMLTHVTFLPQTQHSFIWLLSY